MLGLGAAMFALPNFGAETVPLIFLMGVLGVAYLFGLGPSLLAAFLSMACYNFSSCRRSIPSLLQTRPTSPRCSSSFHRFGREQSNSSRPPAGRMARNRAAITSALYTFSRNLASNASLDDLLWASVSQIAASLKASATILLPDAAGRLAVAASFPPGDLVDDADIGAEMEF